MSAEGRSPGDAAGGPPPGGTSGAPGAPEESALQALARARRHGRAAARESAAALRALLDATALATSGRDASVGGLAPLAEQLDALGAWLEAGAEPDAARLLDAVLDALDEEIGRWEARSREEPEARPVLRAFLAVRELLFELGVRRGRGAGDEEPSSRGGLTRVPVEG